MSIQPKQDKSSLYFVAETKENSTVIDVGCFGWTLSQICADRKVKYVGIDRVEPPGKPVGALFAAMSGHSIDLNDDIGDLVVAAHVIEHLHAPVEFVVELARITRPGGKIFLEAPSELSAQPRSSDDPQDQSFNSFWDDPTHVRPYTPAALYRLALSTGLIPELLQRGWSGPIPVVRMLARVPFEGSIGSRYVSLKDVPYGLANAMNHIWPEYPANAADEARLTIDSMET